MKKAALSFVLLAAALSVAQPPNALAQNPPGYSYHPLDTGTRSAMFVNSRRQIAGDELLGFFYSDGCAPFFYENGILTPLQYRFAVSGLAKDGLVSGSDGLNYGIKTWRQGVYSSISPAPYVEVYGASPTGRLTGSCAGNYGTLPGYYESGSWTTLPAVGCETCGADGYVSHANVDGVMVGRGDSGNGLDGPIVWRNNIYSYLPVVGEINDGSAVRINRQGTIVGYSGRYKGWSHPTLPAVSRATVWINDVPTALSGPNSWAWGVADSGASSWDVLGRGIIVGEAGGLAAVWIADSTGQFQEYNLNSLLLNQDPGNPLLAAYSINSCGVIVGECAEGSFMAVPIDSTDTDADGLYDSWEICGIDGDLNGSIDLELPRANPLRKDLYVELDVANGASWHYDAMVAVVDVFESAPVPNPDGSLGISLHFVGDMIPEAPEIVCDPCIDDVFPLAQDQVHFTDNIHAEFTSLRCSWFGSQYQRTVDLVTPHPNRAAILQAKSKSFRYGIAANSITKGGKLTGGWGEIPGNAFTTAPPSASNDEYAGTLMHELGHTLGLRHGGDFDNEIIADQFNYKPNYPSVMNYTWNMPVRPDASLPGLAQDAIALWRASWALRFSRGTMPTIDENYLPSPANLDGELGGWVPVGLFQPQGNFLAESHLVPMRGPFQWDPAMPGPVYGQNVNYIFPLTSVDADTSLDILTDHNDWEALILLPRNYDSWDEHEAVCLSAPSMATATRSSDLLRGRRLGEGEELAWDTFLAMGRLRFDCNRNGVPDDEEIASGTALDENANAIPDACEGIGKVAVPEPESATSRRLLLGEASPNPFSSTTALWFELTKAGRARLAIFDARGRQVRLLADRPFAGSRHQLNWDGTDQSGNRLAAGLYFYRLEVGDEVLVKRVVLLQ